MSTQSTPHLQPLPQSAKKLDTKLIVVGGRKNKDESAYATGRYLQSYVKQNDVQPERYSVKYRDQDGALARNHVSAYFIGPGEYGEFRKKYPQPPTKQQDEAARLQHDKGSQRKPSQTHPGNGKTNRKKRHGRQRNTIVQNTRPSGSGASGKTSGTQSTKL